MNQKGFANIVLIIALVITIVGAGAYFMMTKEPNTPSIITPTRQPLPQTDNNSSQVQPSVSQAQTESPESQKNHKITFVFLDEKTNYPITNKTVTIQERRSCKIGVSCNPPTLFKGSTNNSGQLSVGSDIFTKNFNIIIDGYFVIGPFQECYNGADTVCYPNPKKVASDSFDPNKDSVVTVIAQAQN